MESAVENASLGSAKHEPKEEKLELVIIYNGLRKPLKASITRNTDLARSASP